MDIPFWIQICSALIGLFLSGGLFMGGIGYFLQGRDQKKLNANNILQQDVSALTERINSQDNEIKRLTLEVKGLHDAIDQRDKKFAESILMLQGRDPQMQDLMKSIKDYMELGKPILENLKVKYNPIMDELKNFLDYYNENIKTIIQKLDKHLEAQKLVGNVLSQK